jgi:hypothetical protein
LASHLHETIHQSTHTMDRLDDQSESVLEQTKHVTRRADRLTRSKQSSWLTNKNDVQLVGKYAIRHVATGRYLGMIQGGVYLVPRFQASVCVMGLYKRKGKQAGCGLVGIKSSAAHPWMGQNFFGSLDGSATTFSHRQEWELDEGCAALLDNKADVGAEAKESSVATSATTTTRLLCASAGWGTGGYLIVGDAPHFPVTIGASGVDGRKKAAMWSLEHIDK